MMPRRTIFCAMGSPVVCEGRTGGTCSEANGSDDTDHPVVPAGQTADGMELRGGVAIRALTSGREGSASLIVAGLLALRGLLPPLAVQVAHGTGGWRPQSRAPERVLSLRKLELGG